MGRLWASTSCWLPSRGVLSKSELRLVRRLGASTSCWLPSGGVLSRSELSFSGEIGCRLCLAIYVSLFAWSVSLNITGWDCVSDLDSLTCPASSGVLVSFPTDSSSEQDGPTTDAAAPDWQSSWSCSPSELDALCSWFPSVNQLLTGFSPS